MDRNKSNVPLLVLEISDSVMTTGLQKAEVVFMDATFVQIVNMLLHTLIT